MGVALALLGFFIFVIGLITLIKPISALKIPTRTRALQVVVGGFAVFIAGAIIGPHDKDQDSKPSATATLASTPTPAPVKPPTPALPSDEARLIEAVAKGREAFRAAPNDMAKGGVRASRKTAICQALSQLAVRGWIGKIATLSSNSDGKGVLVISIARDVSVKTWNNELSDAFDRTLIPTDSALFRSVSKMKVSDTVTFSGSFIQADPDCIRETSLTLAGSMIEPEFLFRFDSVEMR